MVTGDVSSDPSSFERTGGQKEIPSCEVKVEDGSILGPVAPEHHLLGVFHHVGIVGHIHVLQGSLVRQLGEVPQSDC